MGSDKELVSVITLTYKNYDNLFITISSVLEQDCPLFEYIISDDGSGDFPKQKIIDYIEENKKDNLERYEIILNKNNVGTVKHLNNVIKICRGEYIFDISSNDLFVDSHVISRMIETFQSERCDVLIVSRFDYKYGRIIETCPHYYDWKKVKKLDSKEKRLSAFLKTEHFDMFIGPNCYYKKSVIERNGYFDENYKLLEDAPMIAKFLVNENVCIRPDVFSVLYECKSGVSAPGSRNKLLIEDLRK